MNGRDKWKKYERKVKESLEGVGSVGKSWRERLEEGENEEWRKRMDRSEQSLGVYRKVVTKRGEMERAGATWQPEIRAWWRRFRSGLIIGNNRGNWWNGTGCLFCGKEKGGIEHFTLECMNEEVQELVENVLDDITVSTRRNVEEGERWDGLTRKEKIWCSLGTDGEQWRRVQERGGEVWWTEWKEGKWDERLKERRENKRGTTRREELDESWIGELEIGEWEEGVEMEV